MSANGSSDLFGEWWKDSPPTVATAEVRAVTYAEASELILLYEWLGTMPSQLHSAIGLYFSGRLSAVECFTATRPAGKYSCAGKQALCLARGATAHYCPEWASSYLISRAVRLQDASQYWFCVAYADTDAGEIGTVYQASNWTCLGPVSRGNKYWLSPSGKRYDHERPRSVARSRDPDFLRTKSLNPAVVRGVMDEMLGTGWTHITGGVRYRYATPIYRTQHQRKERQKMLDALSTPYPKRKT
jgi:hypothetical protein